MVVIVAEKQRDAPDAGDAHQGKDDTRDGAGLSPEEIPYKIETENTDAAPVDGADDGQD